MVLESHIGDAKYFQGRVLLATTKKFVDELNDEMVERIPGGLHAFHSIDTVGLIMLGVPCSQLNSQLTTCLACLSTSTS